MRSYRRNTLRELQPVDLVIGPHEFRGHDHLARTRECECFTFPVVSPRDILTAGSPGGGAFIRLPAIIRFAPKQIKQHTACYLPTSL